MWLCQDVQPFFSIYSRISKKRSVSVSASGQSSCPPFCFPLSSSSLCFSSLTVIPHLRPACDVYPRPTGHGKMATVALATEWRAGGESERCFFLPFLFLFGWMFRLEGKDGDCEKRAAVTQEEKLKPVLVIDILTLSLLGFWSEDSFTLFIAYLTETPSLWASGTVRASVCCCVCV